QYSPSPAQIRLQSHCLLRRSHRQLKIRAARLHALLGKKIGLQIEQQRVIWLLGQLGLHRGQRVPQIVLLRSQEALCGDGQRLPRVKLLRGIEIGLGFIVLTQLYVQNAPRQIQRRGLRKLRNAVADHIDAHLIRIVRRTDVGEVEVKIEVLRLQQY